MLSCRVVVYIIPNIFNRLLPKGSGMLYYFFFICSEATVKNNAILAADKIENM